MENQRGSRYRPEVNRQDSSIVRFNDTNINPNLRTSAYRSEVNSQDSSIARFNDTNIYPNLRSRQQMQGSGLLNGYNGYESRYPNFEPNFSNNSMQYAYAAPPRQAAAMNMDGYAGVNMNMNMRRHAATASGYYYDNNPNSYLLRRRPRPQSNRLQTHRLQPAGRFDCRRNGLVGARCIERRRPATSTSTDTPILDENICVGPRYMRIRPQRSRSGTGGALDEYNLPGFITEYENAKFFVIKSYDKENLLNSIRHGVWTSSWRGNRVLNEAYAEAHGEQSNQGDGTNAASPSCPVFLLFSINRSKKFCGIAQMVGPVDFEATTEFWNWRGKFPVKWHIIKDVPFKEVHHITLDNDQGNRSIIYSRDVQQVEMEKGQAVVHIFNNYVWSTSLLDLFTLRRARVNIFVTRPTTPPPGQQGQPEEEEEVKNKLNQEEAAGVRRKKEGKEPGTSEVESGVRGVCGNSINEEDTKSTANNSN